jgi:phospholipid/cholesterol/gamma-HCH transport system permease protein
MAEPAVDDHVIRPEVRLVGQADGAVRVQISGTWRLDQTLPDADALFAQIRAMGSPRQLALDARALTSWDSGLVTFVMKLADHGRAQGLGVDESELPAGVQGLLRLARAVPPRTGARRPERPLSFLANLGYEFQDFSRSTGEIVAFLGESVLAFRHLVTGQARLRRSELMLTLQESGPNALPIVSLISFLVGLILAYIGAAQLAQFGARIFVADLVGLAMAREMGAMMTAIILAGRTGAAFAAQLGTMQVNQEIDALRTLGISPMEFLVLPRMLALILMTPLLTLYSNLLGILGGAFVGTVVGGLNLTEYLLQTQSAVHLNDVAAGLIKSMFYGAIVAISGCMRGMQAGRDAAAVGLATTSAVVTAIVFIVVASAVLTIVFDAVGL